MREYVVVPETLLGEPTGVQSWCGRALIYALFRPPKPANAAARREKARRAR